MIWYIDIQKYWYSQYIDYYEELFSGICILRRSLFFPLAGSAHGLGMPGMLGSGVQHIVSSLLLWRWGMLNMFRATAFDTFIIIKWINIFCTWEFFQQSGMPGAFISASSPRRRAVKKINHLKCFSIFLLNFPRSGWQWEEHHSECLQ